MRALTLRRYALCDSIAPAVARKPFNPNLIPVPVDKPGEPVMGPLTVSQVTAMVKRVIEEGLPPTVHVVGEISNFKRHLSGHLYLTLKDAQSELSCVMWRSGAAKLKFAPKDGLEVIATGSVEVFERAGRYQFYIRKLEPRGVGALELAFRQLRKKLSNEGLFDEKRKQPLPPYPTRIALVTSPTGAAVADIVRTIQRRYPCVSLLLYPVRVQGPGAAEEIAAAIRRISEAREQLGGVDVMIVGRGGGSLEDLWAFNEEIVARAIYASRVPIISAVGHEVDVSIADLVADVRAATPTAAAELAVPVLGEVLADVDSLAARMNRTLSAGLELSTTRLTACLQRYPYRDPLVMPRRLEQQVDELSLRLERSGPATTIPGLAERAKRLGRLLPAAMHRRLVFANEQLRGSGERLAALSYKSVLGRGFSITRTKKGRLVVRSPKQLEDHMHLVTEVADGEFESRVVNLKQLELFD